MAGAQPALEDEEAVHEGQPPKKDWPGSLLAAGDASPKQLAIWHSQARIIAKRIVGRLIYQKRKAVQEWPQEQVEEHHMHGLHVYIREPSRALQRSRLIDQRVVSDPRELAAARRDDWKQWCCRASWHLQDTLNDMQVLRGWQRTGSCLPSLAMRSMHQRSLRLCSTGNRKTWGRCSGWH